MTAMGLSFELSSDSDSDTEEYNDANSMCTSDEELNCSFGDLPTPFGSSGLPTPFPVSTPSRVSLHTPQNISPPPFMPDFSPFEGESLIFSPHIPSTPTSSRTRTRTPMTPIQQNTTQTIVPTPDFSILKRDQLGTRKLTRTASSNEIPLTPQKVVSQRSRLTGNITPARPNTPAIHSPKHFSHQLTPKISNLQAKSHLSSFESLIKIGKGSFSTVYKALSKQDNRWYAIKILNRSLTNDLQRSKLIQELKYVKEMNHPHVLGYIFCWEQQEKVHYQMEWCEGGSLSTFMTNWQKNNPNRYVDESLLWKFLTDISLGLSHIHALDVVHHDLKPGNLFVDKQKHLKIGDFGLAGPEHVLAEGDSRYLAPELMDDACTKASDVFSLGATMFELACLIEMPMNDEMWDVLRQGKVSQLDDFPSCYSHEFRMVVDVMMHPDPSQRPTVEQILEHRVIREQIEWRKRSENQDYINLALTPKRIKMITPPFISDFKIQRTAPQRRMPRRNLFGTPATATATADV